MHGILNFAFQGSDIISNPIKSIINMMTEKLVVPSSSQHHHDHGDDQLNLGVAERQDPEKEQDFQWIHVMPQSVQFLKYIILSPRRFCCIKYLYYAFSVILLTMGVILAIFVLSNGPGEMNFDNGASVPFMIFFYTQFMMYLYFPFYYYPLIRDVFMSKDVQLLFQEAIVLSSFTSLQKKFRVVYVTNIILTAVSMVVYMYVQGADWGSEVYSAVWFVFYIAPISIVFGLIVCILEAHRIQAMALRKKLVKLRITYESSRKYCDTFSCLEKGSITSEFQSVRNVQTDMTVFRASNNGSNGAERDQSEPSTLSQRHVSTTSVESETTDESNLLPLLLSIEDIMQHYLRLHDAFHVTSDKRGFFVFSCFLLPLLILISSIWSIYEKFFSFHSTIGYIIMALFYLLEIGLMVASVNETGNLVCRDISSFLLRIVVHNSSDGGVDPDGLSSSSTGRKLGADNPVTVSVIHKINGFVSCLVYIKIEIPFFGNFTLRSRTLLAIVASLVGAIIPGIVRSVV